MAEVKCKYCDKDIDTKKAYSKPRTGMCFVSSVVDATILAYDYFCNRNCHTRWAYGIPKDAIEVDGIQGAKIGYSELAIHTRKAGWFIRQLWSHEKAHYGYATIKGNPPGAPFIHGLLHIHDQHNVSFS
jgi:hypothetical protein